MGRSKMIEMNSVQIRGVPSLELLHRVTCATPLVTPPCDPSSTSALPFPLFEGTAQLQSHACTESRNNQDEGKADGNKNYLRGYLTIFLFALFIYLSCPRDQNLTQTISFPQFFPPKGQLTLIPAPSMRRSSTQTLNEREFEWLRACQDSEQFREV